MFYNTILAIFLFLKSFISKLHEIYIVASQKFEEFGNECPHYTPSKALCSNQFYIHFFPPQIHSMVLTLVLARFFKNNCPYEIG